MKCLRVFIVGCTHAWECYTHVYQCMPTFIGMYGTIKRVPDHILILHGLNSTMPRKREILSSNFLALYIIDVFMS